MRTLGPKAGASLEEGLTLNDSREGHLVTYAQEDVGVNCHDI